MLGAGRMDGADHDLLIHQDSGGGRLSGRSSVNTSEGHGAQGHSSAPEHRDGVAARLAGVAAVDQPALAILQTRRGQPIHHELDRFCEGERLSGSERDRVVRRVVDGRAELDDARIPGGERTVFARGGQPVNARILCLGCVDRPAEVDGDLGRWFFFTKSWTLVTVTRGVDVGVGVGVGVGAGAATNS